MNKNMLVWLAVVGALVVAIFTLTTPAKAVNKIIGNEELSRLQASGAWIIDVRTPAEYAGAHIPGAINVPLDQLTQAASAWDKNHAIVVYCSTGARSTNAAAYLSAQGFRKVYNLGKGIVAWNGQVASGGDSAGSLPTGPGTVKTSGKPVFIDFALST